jgi:hypothetical protein
MLKEIRDGRWNPDESKAPHSAEPASLIADVAQVPQWDSWDVAASDLWDEPVSDTAPFLPLEPVVSSGVFGADELEGPTQKWGMVESADLSSASQTNSEETQSDSDSEREEQILRVAEIAFGNDQSTDLRRFLHPTRGTIHGGKPGSAELTRCGQYIIKLVVMASGVDDHEPKDKHCGLCFKKAVRPKSLDELVD